MMTNDTIVNSDWNLYHNHGGELCSNEPRHTQLTEILVVTMCGSASVSQERPTCHASCLLVKSLVLVCADLLETKKTGKNWNEFSSGRTVGTHLFYNNQAWVEQLTKQILRPLDMGLQTTRIWPLVCLLNPRTPVLPRKKKNGRGGGGGDAPPAAPAQSARSGQLHEVLHGDAPGVLRKEAVPQGCPRELPDGGDLKSSTFGGEHPDINKQGVINPGSTLKHHPHQGTLIFHGPKR